MKQLRLKFLLLTAFLASALGASAQVVWNNSAAGKIEITYSLIAQGPNAYQYGFNIGNVGEPSGIWFLMFHSQSTILGATTILSLPEWGISQESIIGPNQEPYSMGFYDASPGNLFNKVNAIKQNTTATGLTLTVSSPQSTFAFEAYRAPEPLWVYTSPNALGQFVYTYGGIATEIASESASDLPTAEPGSVTPVPEPSTYGLLGAGALGLLGLARRFRRRQA